MIRWDTIIVGLLSINCKVIYYNNLQFCKKESNFVGITQILHKIKPAPIFNDSAERRAVTIALEQKTTADVRELVNGHTIRLQAGQINLMLEGEDVAVIRTN